MSRSGSATLSTTELFCKAAEKLSFTAAANSLGTTPSAVSKAVRRLEDRLGVDLFRRTTRSIRLTHEGQAYYEACRQALAQIEHSEEMLQQVRSDPTGTLRVSLPFSYAIKRLVPLIPRFQERHPGKIRLCVSLSNELVDFAGDDFDLAIRLGRVADSGLVARRLHDAQFRVVASPQYLREHGSPQRPVDLREHRCIDLVLPATGRPIPWQFLEGTERREAKVSCCLELNHPIAVSTAALAGVGLARLLDFTVEEELRAGALVEVLSDFRPPGEPVSVVYPGSHHRSAKVRALVNFLVEVLADPEQSHKRDIKR
jgi:DNA-binding transcriptional LysR family regulator